MKAVFPILLVLAALTVAHAQQSKPVDASTPALSTEEDLRWQILQLETQLETAISQANACQGTLGQWRAKAMSQQLTADEQVLKAYVEQRHPGYDFDAKTRTFSQRPDPPKPAEKAKP